ncbi:MAG TPA: CHAT domain-containing protein [Thermoanaerobaculia bacterium]
MSGDLLEAYLRGLNHIQAKETEKAVSLWEKTKVVTEDRRLGSWIWLKIGESWSDHREWGAADTALMSALNNLEDPFAKSVLWQSLGHNYAMQSKYDLANQAYRSALEIREEIWASDSLALAEALNALGEIAFGRGDLKQADSLFGRALEIRQRLAPGSLGVAESANNFGTIKTYRGDLERAGELLHRALEIRQKLAPASFVMSSTFNNLGFLAYERGDLDQATIYWQGALEIMQELVPEGLEVAQVLNNLASADKARGNLVRAMEIHRHALEIRQKLAPNSLATAESLNNLGAIAADRKDFEQAANYLERALSVRQELAPDSLLVANSLGNLGSMALIHGNLDAAEDLLRRSLEIRERLAPTSLTVADCLNSLSAVAWARGDLDLAVTVLRGALNIQQELAPDSLIVAGSLNNLGTVEKARGDLAQALNLFQRSLEIRQNLAPDSSDISSTLSQLGLLHRQLDPPQLTVADNYFRHALDALEAQLGSLGGSHDIRGFYRAHYSNNYRNAIETQLERGLPDTAFLTLERSRARSFLEQLIERDTVFTADIRAELDNERRQLAVRFDRAQRKLAALNPRDHGEQIEELLNQLQRFRNGIDDVEERIRQESPKLAALQYPVPLNVSATYESLDAETLLLSFSVGEDSTSLFSISKDLDLRVDTIAVTEEELRRQIQDFRQHLERAGDPESSWKPKTDELALSLFATLLDPIEDRIKSSERLLILADGPLHYLPWGALVRDGEAGPQYLAEWKPHHLALSATVYAELRKQRREGEDRSTPVQLAAFGDPSYPDTQETAARHDDVVVRSVAERAFFEWEPLPYTRREVKAITEVFPPNHTRAYLGEAATEERAKALGRDVRIIHFATHAHLDERFPMSSFLALTIPDKYREGEDNGLLQVWEIYERLRIDADLVVLSACESALGEERRGEGLMGLTRAFQYAGARTVAASLWRVADEATGELMVRFYRHLRAGKSKDEALRAAQIELIHGDDERLRLPYYWAAFQIYGDWQ